MLARHFVSAIRHRAAPALCALLVLALIAAGTIGTPAQQAGDYVIGPQDVLQVTVFGQPDLTGQFTVEADGTFTFPLIGRVKAAGRTLRQFEGDLKKLLADGFLKDPQVSVGVQQYRSQRIFVVGEVRQPGTYPLTGDMTLIEALALAGSTLPSASGEAIIVHAKDPRAVTGPLLPSTDQATDGVETRTVDIRALQSGQLSENVQLQDGDTIFVPAAENVYVFGEVNHPGSFPIKRNTTVLQALSLAGGATQYAALNRVKIIRIVNGEKKELKVGLADLVQAGDTIVVPQRYF